MKNNDFQNEIYQLLIGEKNQINKEEDKKKKKKITVDDYDLGYILQKYTNGVNQKYSNETLRKNGPFLTSISSIFLQKFQKLVNDLEIFHKTKFLQINFDALSTKDKPVRRRKTGYKKQKQVLDNPEEQKIQIANKFFLEKKQEQNVQEVPQNPVQNPIRSNQEKNMTQKLEFQDLQFQDLAEPNLNLIEQLPHQRLQSNIEKQESIQEEQINVTGGLTMGSYNRVHNDKKKRKQYDYIIDNINNKVANKFIEGQDLEKVITGNIQLGVKRLQNQELISVLLNVQPKVRIYSHLLPSKLELKTYEKGNRPVQELRGQNSNIIQEQLQDFGFGFGFLDDKPLIEQEPSQHVQPLQTSQQMHSQQMHSQLMYSQQIEIELTKNFTYSFQHSGLLFNSFVDKWDKAQKFYLLMCQCQKSKNFRIEQQDVLQFGPIQLIRK